MDYIAQPKDYWIAQGAITITLNALGNPNRMQGSVASGAAILCYIEGVDGLGYDNGHRFKTWPLSLSPTYFNSNTQKYVYAAIPRSASVGTQAVVVFPSEKLDVYGKNSDGAQVGSSDYYYIWLQGIISSSGDYGTTNRELTGLNFGMKGTDEDLYDDTDGEWYQYSKVSEIVTFLKNITMKAGATFYNLYLGYKELTGVATSDIAYTDSDTLVATPGYVESQYLSKTHESEAQEQIGFLKGLWVGVQGLYGWLKNGNITAADGLFSGMLTALRAVIDTMSSSNYQGGQLTGTGWQITNSDESGNSRLEVDNLVVRMKMLVNVLEARKYVALGGNYVYSPASSVLEQVDYYDSNGNLLGYETIKVPFLVRLIPILANTKLYSRSRIISNKGDVNMSNVAYFRCWIKADDGTTRTINTWQPGMLARCQTLDIDAGGGGAHNEVYYEDKPYELTAGGNKLYWREVIATGQAHYPVNDDGNVHSYVDISNITGHFLAGSDVPGVGDNIVCYGGTKVDYANVIVIETVGADAPAIKEMMGVGLQTIGQDNTSGQLPVFAVTSDNLRTRISPKTGNRFIAPEFYIEATVGGARTNLATFIVNTEGFLSYVKGVIADGKNLFSGALTGAGWYSEPSVPYDNHPQSEVSVDSNGYMNVLSGGNYICKAVTIERNVDYALSLFGKVTSSFQVGVWITASSAVNWQQIATLSFSAVSSTDTRRVKSFKLSGSGSVTILFTIPLAAIRYPQLELGEEATDFVSGDMEVSSRIKQEADTIEGIVTTKLGETGIKINGNNRQIDLIAGKVNFCNSQGTAQTYVQITSDGKIKATDGEFSGKIVANSGKISSGIIDGNWLISSYGQIDGDEYGDTDEFEGHLAHLYFDPSNPQGKKGIPLTANASGVEPDITYADAASVVSNSFTPTAGLRIIKITAGISYGQMKVAVFSGGSMITGSEITLTENDQDGYIVFTSTGQQCEIRAHMTEDSIYGSIDGIIQIGFAPHFGVDLSAGKSYQDDANIGGIIKAQIAYTPTKTYNRSTTAETIVPGANYPSAYRVVTGTANKVFTLPDPRDYDGLELSFFVTQYPGTGYGCILKAPTGYSIYFNKHQVVYIDGSNFALPVVNEVESKTQVICGFGQNVTLRAMDNNWYVVQGRVS